MNSESDYSKFYHTKPFFWWAIVSIIGIILSLKIESNGLIIGTVAFIFSCLIFIRFRTILFSFLLFLSSFFLATEIHEYRFNQLPQIERLKKGGRIPVIADGMINQLLPSRKTAKGGFSTTLKLNSILLGGKNYKCQLKVRLLGSTMHTAPEYGSSVKVRGNIQLPRQAKNPGQFDIRKHLKSRNIIGEVIAGRNSSDIEITLKPTPSILGHSIKAKRWIADKITADLENSPNSSALLKAMFLGAKEEAPTEMVDRFRYSGTLHVFAVSGLHVGLVGLILWAILVPLGLPRKVIIVLVGVLLVTYTCITGLRPSAVRATTMALVVLFGMLIDRQPKLLNSLGVAALIMLIINPYKLLDIGFQLSFGVLLAIALFVPFFRKLLSPMATHDPFIPSSLLTNSQKLFYDNTSRFRDMLAVSIAAWIGSLPFNLLHFSLITPIALIANPIILLLTSAVLFGTILSTIFSLTIWTSYLAILINNTNHLIGSVVLSLVGMFSNVPGGHQYVSLPELSLNDKSLSIDILDLPRGGSCHIISPPDSAAIMIDCGDENSFRSTIFSFLKKRGIKNLDHLFLTHQDMRHMGGLEQLLSTLQIKTTHGPPKETNQVAQYNTDNINGRVTVLFPPKGELSSIRDNQAMIILYEWEDWRFLFKSDAGFEAEKYLLKHQREDIHADVIITGKHIRDYSLLEEFVLAVNPKVVIATNALYPPNQTIEEPKKKFLTKHNIKLFDQLETGAIRIIVEATQELKIEGYLGNQITISK